MRADPGPDTVYVEGATYRLLTPLTLSAADSNSSFLAYPGQQPVLSGGTPVGGWTAGADGIWHAHLALNSVTQFVVNGLAQTESRFPNYDAAQPITGGWLWTQPLPAGYDPNLDLAYNKADFPAGAPVAGEKITVFDQYGFESDVLTIASVDSQNGIIQFTDPSSYPIGTGSRYYISGSASLIDQPGEWSFDPATQTLSYLPPAGFDGTGGVAAGGDQTLIAINGATNVTISGLTFSDVATSSTSGALSTAAITAINASSDTIDGNTFHNVSEGVLMDDASHGNTISNNDFNTIWSAAIDLTPTSYQNVVTNNTINNSGEFYRTGAAIQLTETWGNTISHNLIQNVPRFGISDSNYDSTIKSGANNIEYNTILNSGQQTQDVGAIYVTWNSDTAALGDTIRYNDIVNTGGLGTTATGFISGQHLSWGIYLDNYTSDAQVYGNFVSGTALGGVMLHGGINNQVYNNILINNGMYGVDAQEMDSVMTGTSIYHNLIAIPLDPNAPILGLDPNYVSPASVHDNIYVSPSGQKPYIGYDYLSYAQWLAMGGDAGTDTVTSAGFTNPAANNYSFIASAFALSQGIQQLPWTAMGPVGITITGGLGNATLISGGGNDVLRGGAGIDVMIGRQGNDTYYINNTGDIVSESAGQGTDTVYASVNYTLPSGSAIEYLRANAGANGLTLAGNELANTIVGGSGNDTLIGGAGNDVLKAGSGVDAMLGGQGNDTYYVDNPGDVVTEAAGQGTDTVYASVSYTLPSGSEIEYLRANAGANALTLTGNELANTIVGGSGNDTLIGGDGNDVLKAGSGTDVMVGGQGNDTYYVDNPGDVVTESAGQGTDTVYTSVSYALPSGSAIEFLRANAGATGLTLSGNALANTIVGGPGNDTLIGHGGGDVLTGGSGADYFVFTALSDSTVAAAGRATITDFSSLAGDKIDLHLIDAVASLAGDQSFNFIGANAFSGAPGQLNYVASGRNTLISADTNGNKVADFSILVDGVHTFSAPDFIL